MLIFLIVVGALSVGLILGSATARVGYALDRDVRDATRSLEEAKEEWEKAKAEFEPIKRTDNSYYDAQNKFARAVDNLRGRRTYAIETYKKNRIMYMWIGGVMIFLWPVGIVVGLLGGTGLIVYRLGSKAILYALNPAQYDEHNELLKGTMAS